MTDGTVPEPSESPDPTGPTDLPPGTADLGEAIPETPPAPAPQFARGDRIGPYVLLDPIGSGAYGGVWRAEQREPVRRTVALKILHAGMNSSQVVARFRAEQQALAMMDHPGIARVFDAGLTPSGLPYFAMQYVKGDTLLKYCDRERLSLHERLQLFTQICDAVHHAHIKGVVHRDLKPSNVVVTADETGTPQPVVIDFGVAKALLQPLTEDTVYSVHGGPQGTWAYMSPEQAEGIADIDTRSDIYSLGVVLYELLSGARPFDDETLDKAGDEGRRRLIREVEPPSPGARIESDTAGTGTRSAQSRQTSVRELAKTLTGELSWIPLYAMRKDRRHRYDSASQFAVDIRNYLEGKPLIAGPESVGYRVGKFVRRNRGPVVATSALLLALALGLLGTLKGLREANLSRLAAEAATGETTSLLEFIGGRIVEPLRDGSATTTGSATVDLRAVFDQAAKQAESAFAQQPVLAARMLTGFADVLIGVGATSDAIAALDAARRAAKEAGLGAVAIARIDLTESQALWRDGRAEEAYRLASAAIEVLRKSHAPAAEVAEALNMLGGSLKHAGAIDEAETHYREALDIRESATPPDVRPTLILRHNLALVEVARGIQERKTNSIAAARRFAAAIEAERSVWNDAKRELGDNDADALAPASEVGVNLIRLANLTEDDAKRTALLTEAAATYAAIVGPMRGTLTNGHWRTLQTEASQGLALQLLGRHSEAVSVLEPALEEYRVYRGRTYFETIEVTRYLVRSLVASGRACSAADQLRRAIAELEATGIAGDAEQAAALRTEWPDQTTSTLPH